MTEESVPASGSESDPATAAQTTTPSVDARTVDPRATGLSHGDASTDEPSMRRTSGSRSTSRRRWISLAVGAALGAAIVAALFLIQLPYFVVQPGSVRPAEQRIEIEGAKSFNDPGRVMFVTVFINRANPALMIRSWLDDSIDVRSQKEMYPNGNEKEARQENIQLMDTSKLVAKKVALSYLGLPAEFTSNGALIAGLVEQSPAKGKLEPGDVVVQVDGNAVALPQDIGTALSGHQPGETVDLTIERPTGSGVASEQAALQSKRVKRNIEMALGADPKDPQRPVLGVYVEPFGLSVDSPIGVQVDSGDVTGPSAGLAWTLGIIDRLTPGSLTDGRRVAVTGEMHADGTIGPVGGTPQKVAAVKRAGVKIFIYPDSTPESDKRQISRIAGEDMKTYAVGTIEEAVKVLAPNGVEKP